MDVSQHEDQVKEISEKLEKSLSMDTDDKMTTYYRLIQNGKDVAKGGDMHKALEFFKRAHKLHYSEKLERRIKKIEELIAENESEEEDEEFVNVNNCGLMLFKELHSKLYDYQRNGVAFLYSLYRDGRKGGILADDMGLGKTIQVISFLSGMYDNELVKYTMLIMPTSLITNWTKEFAKWTPGMRVKEFHGVSKGERTRNLEKVQRRGGVIITTYTMLINNWQQLSSYNGREFTWDYMILDEAHKIKSNTTKTAKSAYAIPSKNRVLLTGTPVQNNLREMWALFDFACQGTLLGTAKTFKAEYENPITRAREKDATPGERALGFRMSENLMAIITPYFLRRTKAEVQKNKTNAADACKEEHTADNSQVPNQPEDPGAVMPTLTRKNDLIIWTYLSPVQEDIYRQFISLDHIKELLLTTRSPLAELNILKKLCDHPRLLSARAIATLGLEESAAADEESDSHSIAGVPDETLISESGKLMFLFTLIEQLKQEGHRTLVFAHYRKVLDIIERILGNRGFKVLRLDGTITHIAERERRISLFQRDSSYSVFLLTTQVGGVGITLTAANRVVIYDPSWNPATDAQAVDRAYRIGQKENVVIYRLITCGTVEEKIYRRQVFKDSLIRQNTGDKKNPFRYFSKQELKELFTLEDTRSSSTQLQLQAMHSRHRRTDAELDEHIARLHTMEMFGISDHDLMFSLDVNQDEGLENQEEHHYIEGRVQKAQDLMKAESELQMQLAENMASSTEPAWLRQSLDNNRELSQNNRTRNPKTGPESPQNDQRSSRSLVEVDSNSLESCNKDGQLNLSDQVIDLTADESMTEQKPVVNGSQDKVSEHSLGSPRHPHIKQEDNCMDEGDVSPQEGTDESLIMFEPVKAAVADVASVSVTEQMDRSAVSGATLHSVDEHSPEYITASDKLRQNLTSPSEHNGQTPLQNKSVSMLRASNLSFRADASSRVSNGLESFEGNFNLELEDSEVLPDADVQDPQETEAAEKELLAQLKFDGSFDVNKSLSEREHREAAVHGLDDSRASGMDESMNTSIVAIKKKRAAVIYDSDDGEEPSVNGRQCDRSFQVLGASTPKSAPTVSTPLRSRQSLAGNTSVASRRSLVHSIIEDMDHQSLDNDEDGAGDEDGYSSEMLSYEAEEDESVNSNSAPESEEPAGETLNTEGEEDVEEEEEIVEEEEEEEEEMVEEEEEEEEMLEEEEEEEKLSDSEDTASKSGENMNMNLEESMSEPELTSTESVEKCTVRDEVLMNEKNAVEVETYDYLVSKGKECIHQGKKDDALNFFLKAIDIKPGDPEIQLLTIQLYRQLSQRS